MDTQKNPSLSTGSASGSHAVFSSPPFPIRVMVVVDVKLARWVVVAVDHRAEQVLQVPGPER